MYSDNLYFLIQLGPKKVVSLSLIEEKWRSLALPMEQFQELVRIGNFGGDIEWLKFFALGCSTLGDVSIDLDGESFMANLVVD